MRKGFWGVAVILSLALGAARADVLTVPEGEPASEPAPDLTLPAKGTTMADVERKFGEPRARQPTVGGDTPQQPPITRWDYDGFSVVFEHDRVVDTVVPGAPPRIYHTDQLSAGPVPPGASMPKPMPEPTPEPDMESGMEAETGMGTEPSPEPEMSAAEPADPESTEPPPAEPETTEPEQPDETPAPE